jgi:hypothetical protein
LSLEQELRATWLKYEPQRSAANAGARTRAEAERDLADLNDRRSKPGLPTWRDELDAELLSAIRKHFT